MGGFEIALAESELKITLEALTELEQKMVRLCESPENEDEVSDVGNDLIEVRLLLKALKERAINMYGHSIVNFSREAL
ncbi:hypothetical protein [Microbulbifer litoralis]|uniref:hypothetical protein n=1 Tax=Microbulbifer litoralis TaxID=2933965 RepID=UPI0020281543|nr:hypothetical protein [Microbulbifer sp. GX H0434]